MEQSIRNQLPGTIKSIVSDKVLGEVVGFEWKLFTAYLAFCSETDLGA
jgi:hypothetical protein